MYIFEEVSLLITHYNRTKSLERLLQYFVDEQVKFGEIIVSDDASKSEYQPHLNQLREKFSFNLITTSLNKGLGNNINKGQDQVTKKYTLYIQEDFLPKPLFFDKLQIALDFMKTDQDIDFIRFYAYFKYPHLKPVSDGFSEMVFNHSHIWEGYRKFYLYSDHPHLRKNNFLEKFGRYDEGIKSDRTEYNQMMKVLAVGTKSYFYDDFKSLLDQLNSDEEPSTVKRNVWRNNASFFISFTRHLYRYLRFNIELLVFKFQN
jgi:glycosyltransferase involved in cell wall biosynthesis